MSSVFSLKQVLSSWSRNGERSPAEYIALIAGYIQLATVCWAQSLATTDEQYLRQWRSSLAVTVKYFGALSCNSTGCSRKLTETAFCLFFPWYYSTAGTVYRAKCTGISYASSYSRVHCVTQWVRRLGSAEFGIGWWWVMTYWRRQTKISAICSTHQS